MRRGLLVVVAACGTTPAGPVLGTVQVTIHSNGSPGSEQALPPMPLVGVPVFEEGGSVVMTDANGEATLEVRHDPATIHVADTVLYQAVTTIVDVPVGASVKIGDRPYYMHSGQLRVTLTQNGAPSYSVIGPQGCVTSFLGTPDAMLADILASCGGAMMRLYAVAHGTTSTQVVEQDVSSFGAVTMGAFTDATDYALTAGGQPASIDTPKIGVGVIDPANGYPLYFTGSQGPAAIDFVQVAVGNTATGSQLLVPGAPAIGATIDASLMLPIPDVGTVDTAGAAWSIASSSATPNLVVVTAKYGTMTWTIDAPPSVTSVRFPHLPASAAQLAPSGTPSGSVAYYDLPAPAPLTIDETQGGWGVSTAAFRFDHQPIANSQRGF